MSSSSVPSASDILRDVQADESVPSNLLSAAQIVESASGTVDIRVEKALTYERQISVKTLPESTYEKRRAEGVRYERLDVADAAPAQYESRSVPVVEETTVSPCGDCGGAGRKPCPNCSGSGEQTCSTCGGDERTECRSCGGTGEESCSNCDGSGDVSVEYETPCAKCGGSSRLQCPKCGDNGRVQCPECSGEDEDCPECGGDFTIECSRCRGEGTNDCPRCDATGTELEVRTEQCPECAGSGTQNCHSCGGSGESTCTTCHGTGKEDCYRCSGTAEIDCQVCAGDGTTATGNTGEIRFEANETVEMDQSEVPSDVRKRITGDHGTVVSVDETPPSSFDRSGSEGTVRKTVETRTVPYAYCRYTYDGQEYEAAAIGDGDTYRIYYDDAPIAASHLREKVEDAREGGVLESPSRATIASHSGSIESRSDMRKLRKSTSQDRSPWRRLVRHPLHVGTDALLVGAGAVVATISIFVISIVLGILTSIASLVASPPAWLSNVVLFAATFAMMAFVASVIGDAVTDESVGGYELSSGTLLVGVVVAAIATDQIGGSSQQLALGAAAAFWSLRVGRRLQIEPITFSIFRRHKRRSSITPTRGFRNTAASERPRSSRRRA